MAYSILMDNTKYLKATTVSTLYQGENYCDSFHFIVPLEYNGHNLMDFIATLQYINAENQAFIEILEPDEEIYKEKYIRYSLPITTKLTRSVGDIKMSLKMNHVDKDKKVQYTLHSSEITVTISPTSDYYMFTDETLAPIDKLIGQLDAKLNYLSEQTLKIPEDLGLDDEGTLKLQVGADLVGNGVDVALPSTPDVDGTPDGILDLEEIYKEVMI